MDDKELDEMAKDVETTKIDTQPTEAPSGFVEDKETYVKPDGETTASPERTPNIIKEESGAKKWVLGGLATILILGMGAASAWLYTDAQKARTELQSAKTGLDAARADAAKLRADAIKPAIAPVTGPSFSDFSTEYSKMVEAGAELTEADEAAIEESIEKYYKLSVLPEGWQIVTGYKDAKADKTTGKPINALVFWPASDAKPAGFFEMKQDADGKWQYNDLR